jgi:CheY-like chemotaxis protein
VLCIDDNADMRDYLHSLLAPRYALRFASDGASALQSARREPPDLVISDVMMPGMNGLSLLQALRADDRTRSVPVILLSARAGEEARVEGMQAGADDYLVKPFAARELQARVDAHLRLALLRREAYTALRANERRLRAILDQLPVGVGVCDASGAWMLANALMERCSPCTVPSARSEQAARWRGWDEHGEPVPPENWPARRALRGEMVVPGTEMQYMSEDGEERWMRVSAAPLRADDGELVGACTVVQDVTELMRAEQELRLAHDRKDEFLAVLAHELRNPLAPLHNGLQLLRLSGTGDEQTRRLHDMLARQATHMARLVDDLLDIARITNGKILLRKNPVDLTEVLLNALETCREAIEAQGHELCMDVPEQPLMVEADGMRLAQVVSNLLNNAAKYTDPRPRLSRSRRKPARIGAGQWPRHSGKHAGPRVRAVRASGPRARRGRLGHRPDAGPPPGGTAWWHGRGAQRGAWSGRRIPGAAAGLGTCCGRPAASATCGGDPVAGPHPGGGRQSRLGGHHGAGVAGSRRGSAQRLRRGGSAGPAG